MHDTEMIIGPQHPALKEPVSFKVKIDGEKVVSLDLDISYNHRGIEKGVEQRTLEKNIYLIERICGICSHAHTTNFCKGMEEIMEITVPKRAQYIRVIMAELERIHSHLLWLGVEGHGLGFDTLFMYAWRDRETVQDLMEIISGGRVSHAINKFGGVRRDINDEMKKKILKDIKFLEERIEHYINLIKTEKTLEKRMKGVGYLSYEKALSLSSVGPTARGSGVKIDVRKDDPYLVYDEIPFKIITSNSCDVFGRNYVRVYEMLESIKIIKYAIENLPKGKISVNVTENVKPAEVISLYEAPRGELFHYIKINERNMIDRMHVRTPTFSNWISVIESMKGMHIADIPIVVAAIDPCLSCTARTTIVDTENRTLKTMTWEELNQYSIRWYKERGIGWD
jgi:NADH-quinone oxidoreductase subunit D